MNGKWPAIALLVLGVGAGAGVWYAQEYGFYEQIGPGDRDAQIYVTNAARDGVRQLPITDFQGVNASSSPLRWRACFQLTEDIRLDEMAPYPDATPLNGPRWFGCYDAGQITSDLASGAAVAVLGVPEIRTDTDRVLAIYPDGRAYGWHQYNDKTPERGVMD